LLISRDEEAIRSYCGDLGIDSPREQRLPFGVAAR
jgi:hypothetical protein